MILNLDGDVGPESTDVEIVTASFDLWETDCFKRLVGDWAVCIWKPVERELILAVDYIASRHLFYHVRGQRISWSSDLGCLVVLAGEKFHIDDDYVAGYFAHDPDSWRTPYREIRQVGAGHFVRVRDGSAALQRYWSFNPASRIIYKTDAEYEEHFRDVFRRSVRRRMRSDSTVLAELSGGLDSSSIVCMADDILSYDAGQSPGLDTLSYYDKTEPNGDDWIYFHKIEEKRGKVGAHIDVSKVGNSPSSLEYREFAPLPGYFGATRQIQDERAEIVRQGGYRVVLSGVGGDEFLGGMPDPRAQLGDLIVKFEFMTLAKRLMAWSLVKRRPWIQLLWEASMNLLPAFLGQFVVKDAKVESWIDKLFAKRTKLALRQLDVDEHFGLWLPTRRGHVSALQLLANKMAKHLSPRGALEEMRFPYLDQGLTEFILSIPASQLLRPGERRSLMRRSLVNIVPAEVLQRRTKSVSMRTPLTALGNYWGELQAAMEAPYISYLGYINRPRFLERLRATRNGRETQIMRSLKAISLEFWLRDVASRHLIEGLTPGARSAERLALATST